ncbi:MAG: trehalose-6-phosphate synthase [Planctomycetota bacterium]|nr:trehalose-6-phosphate synthase [Planctomycetota bacterium]
MRRGKRIITIANRLPVHRGSEAGAKWTSSAGGLVTALGPIMVQRGGIWVGWTGASDDAPRPFTHDGIHVKPVKLSASEIQAFYHGMSNKTLWPLYHDALRTPEFHRHWWRPYVTVNERFAKAAASEARPGDVVWVHDYHLQLVPQMLRKLVPSVKIGFFLHIPFPPEELFEWLPWRTELLTGLLGADLVGFQTASSAKNFSRLCRAYAGAEGTDSELSLGGRNTRVGAFPISIDTDWWEERASAHETTKKMMEIRERVGKRRKTLLAVDRLDYTKGISMRLEAFQEMLKTGRRTIEDTVLIQIAVPSREVVSDYASLRDEIELAVGRINGEYSQPGRVAVHYFRRNLTREELAAYYRAADVMLVTPLRDGMNLVAKEYVACRVDNRGVLVLSQFAGAARELTRALIVNPRDTDQVIHAIERALEMPEDEARLRMGILRSRVRRHDVHAWADAFLRTLEA